MEGLLSQRESKGLSLRTLSDRSGIPVGTLSWWSHKLRSEEATESVPTFVELVPSETPRFTAAVPDTEPCEPELRVQHPSGLVLEFRGALATHVAERVLNGIGQWS
jgi:transcriptional regulator with XRE-family HTH domain